MFDDLRLLDAPKQPSGNAALLLTGCVEPGHSGSPLVNSDGRVIGVVSGAHTMSRSIAAGESLDFIPAWDMLEFTSQSRTEVERAIRQHDLRHIPHEIQSSMGRVVGPSAQAIAVFANTVKDAYAAALSSFDGIERESTHLVTQAKESNLSLEAQTRLISFLRERLTTKAAATFALVGGTPATITTRIGGFGE